MKTPKASGALRQAPDPMPRYACFARPTPLHSATSARSGGPELGPTLDQILDPLLYHAVILMRINIYPIGTFIHTGFLYCVHVQSDILFPQVHTTYTVEVFLYSVRLIAGPTDNYR